MNVKKVSTIMLASAMLGLLAAAAFKTVVEVRMDKEEKRGSDGKEPFRLTLEVEERFDKLAHTASRDGHFINGLKELGIDLDLFDSDYITAADYDYITLSLPDGYVIKIGESDIGVNWQVYREVIPCKSS